MEEVLDLYEEPYDPRRPVVCFDETSTQLLAQTRPSLPPRPGIPLRQDYEYRREGVRNLFLACEPQAGWRHVAVTQARWRMQQMRWLVDEDPEVPAGQLEHSPLASTRRSRQRRPGGFGVPLHPQARKLVEYGGQRTVPFLSDSGSPTRELSGGRSRPWLRSATPAGASTPMTPEPNCTASIPLIPNTTEYYAGDGTRPFWRLGHSGLAGPTAGACDIRGCQTPHVVSFGCTFDGA